MPRQARIDYPGALQHVIARGIERKYIFEDDKDKGEFCKRLSRLLEESSMFCYAWCVMGNHFHLLLQTGKTSLAEFMSRLLTGYAVYYNKMHNRSGHLFQNRYKSIVCDKDEYLLSLIRYIHLNPVKAKIIDYDKLDKYIWCGHREILKGSLDILEREEILGYFDVKEKLAVKSYLEFMKDGLILEENYEGGGLIRSAGGWESIINRGKDEREMYDDRILGGGDFVEDVLNEIELEDAVSYNLKNLEELINKLMLYYGISKFDLLNKRVQEVREARNLFVYIGNRYLNVSLTKLGRILGISQQAATVARIRGLDLSQ